MRLGFRSRIAAENASVQAGAARFRPAPAGRAARRNRALYITGIAVRHASGTICEGA